MIASQRVLLASTVLVLLLAPRAAGGQEPRATARVASLTAGVGNVMGWFGVHGEGYFAHERLSAFVGLGYTPSIDPGDPSGPTFAVGLRGFTTGIKHRGFLALSVSQLAVETGFAEDPGRFYGPGLEAGYQFVSLGGSPSWRLWGSVMHRAFPRTGGKSARCSRSAWATPGDGRPAGMIRL